MNINLTIEKPAVFPRQFIAFAQYIQFLAVLSGHGYFVPHGYWFAMTGIEMQELKLNEFWKNHIY